MLRLMQALTIYFRTSLTWRAAWRIAAGDRPRPARPGRRRRGFRCVRRFDRLDAAEENHYIEPIA